MHLFDTIPGTAKITQCPYLRRTLRRSSRRQRGFADHAQRLTVRRANNAALCDDCIDEFGRGYVERGIVDVNARRSGKLPEASAHLLGVALFDHTSLP